MHSSSVISVFCTFLLNDSCTQRWLKWFVCVIVQSNLKLGNCPVLVSCHHHDVWSFFNERFLLLHPCRFLKLQPCGKNGYSPLHLAVDRNTTCVGRYPVCKFPSLTVASILLECGADVNSRDEDDNRSVCLVCIFLLLWFQLSKFALLCFF